MVKKCEILLKDEVLHYFNEEWNSCETWLTTRAYMLKLKQRGIHTTWPTLNARMVELMAEGSIERIKTSNGWCYKPCEETFTI